MFPVLCPQLKAGHHLPTCFPNVGTSLDPPSPSLLCLGPLGPASQMPLESTQAHGRTRCPSSRLQPPSPVLRLPPTFCLGPPPSMDPCPPQALEQGLSLASSAQRWVYISPYLPGAFQASKIIPLSGAWSRLEGTRGTSSDSCQAYCRSQTQLCSPTDHDFGQVICQV